MMNALAGESLAEADHFFRRADFVGEEADGVGALGVGDDGGVRVFGADLFDALAGEFDVDVAVALPEGHLASGLLRDPGAEVFVGDEEDIAVGGDAFDDFHGVAAGADDVARGP